MSTVNFTASLFSASFVPIFATAQSTMNAARSNRSSNLVAAPELPSVPIVPLTNLLPFFPVLMRSRHHRSEPVRALLARGTSTSSPRISKTGPATPLQPKRRKTNASMNSSASLPSLHCQHGNCFRISFLKMPCWSTSLGPYTS